MWSVSTLRLPFLVFAHFNIYSLFTTNIDAILARLTSNNIFTIARRSVNDQELIYLSMKFSNNIVGLAELTVRPAGPAQVPPFLVTQYL